MSAARPLCHRRVRRAGSPCLRLSLGRSRGRPLGARLVEARKVGPNLFRGRSLFDGGEILYRPVGDAARLIVDYHVGTNPRALAPRVMARVVPGEATGRDKGSCLVTLVAWRDASMSEARWERLVACHEVEIRLVQALLAERRRSRR